MKILYHLGSALALTVPLPAVAQDHSEHEGHTAPAPAANPAPAIDHTDHSQHTMGPLLPGTAEGSGTARLPAAEGMMAGVHFGLGGGWSGMAHGFVMGVATDQSGPRGDDKRYVQSMAMLTAERRTPTSRLQLRTMLSAEPLMNDRGYPNLFSTGETANGEPLVDRQHPHDLVMELAARFDLALGDGLTGFVYGGPVGEPALGPSAFMHRASARLNPEAPISHHWFDSTHITYGVITAGLAGRAWQLEGSVFRGQEPDENRWDIEEPRLDSWSVRATLNPSDQWALQVSHGRMVEPEALHPGEDEARTTASVQFNSGAGLSAMAAFSAKNRQPQNNEGGATLTAWLGELNWDLSARHTLFARAENVANDELFHEHAHPLHDQTFRISKAQVGYAYNLPLGRDFGLAIGGSAAIFTMPAALEPYYGTSPAGLTGFVRLTLGQ